MGFPDGTVNISVDIRPIRKQDWPSVRAIYAEGIATGNATFETEPPGWEAWDSAHLRDTRLAAVSDGKIVGWAALSPVSGRCVYTGAAGLSIYVAAAQRGRGVGKALLGALIAESEARGYWTLESGIFPENSASLALHRRCGFRVVGRRERIGRMNGIWRDVLLLERRSLVTGK